MAKRWWDNAPLEEARCGDSGVSPLLHWSRAQPPGTPPKAESLFGSRGQAGPEDPIPQYLQGSSTAVFTKRASTLKGPVYDPCACSFTPGLPLVSSSLPSRGQHTGPTSQDLQRLLFPLVKQLPPSADGSLLYVSLELLAAASGPVVAMEGSLHQGSHNAPHGRLIPTPVPLPIVLHSQPETKESASEPRQFPLFNGKNDCKETSFSCTCNHAKWNRSWSSTDMTCISNWSSLMPKHKDSLNTLSFILYLLTPGMN